MENIRIVKIILPVVAVFLVSVPVRSYSPSTTHHGLTSEIIKFFEYNYPDKKFTDQEKEWIKNGSVDEDHNIRPMNHFYDPIHDRGLWGFKSSKQWASDTLSQANRNQEYLSGAGKITQPLFSSPTDFSWNRAVYEYVHGDKQRAMEALGHVLHLIEDATVPDHVRNDPHPPYYDEVFGQASPYEGWTSKFEESNMAVSKDLIYLKAKPVLHDSLNEYFDKVASFSNENFFSKDSILNYNLPQIIKEEFITSESGKREYFGYGKMGQRLVRILRTFNLKNNKIELTYDLEDEKNIILSDYWEILSKEAVKNGAGVVKLFFDEVEEEKKTLALYNKNKSWISKVALKTKEKLVSLFDKYAKNEVAMVLSSFESQPEQQEDVEGATLKEEPKAEEETVPVGESLTNEDEPDESLDTLPAGPENIPSYPNLAVKKTVRSGGITVENILEEEVEADETENSENYEVAIVEISIRNIEDYQQVLTNSHIVFSGSVTPGSTVRTSFGGEVYSEEGDWEVETTLEEGVSGVEFWAEKDGAISQIIKINVEVDVTGPELFLEAAECSNSISDNRCLLVSETEVHLSWGSDEISEFEIDLNGKIVQSVATSTVFSLGEDGEYVFRVLGEDGRGNKEEKEIEIQKSSMPVVINEIAWAGTAANHEAEWVELYNRTSEDINITNWVLEGVDGTPSITLSGEIPAKGFYLLERSSEDVVSDITADLIYGNAGPQFALNNRGEELFLRFGTVTVDKTPPLNNTEGCGPARWCAGINSQGPGVRRYSMERIFADVSGHDRTNWDSTIGEFILNGKDKNGGDILGTPGQENSVIHVVSSSGILTADKVLTAEHSPYLVLSSGLVINSGITLTLKKGVVIKMVIPDEPIIFIDGSLVAEGTESDPVVITSYFDDEYGGDIDGGACSDDNPDYCPDVSSWRRIVVNPTGLLDLNHALVRYGGTWSTSSSEKMRGMIVVDGGTATFDNVVMEKSKRHGIYFQRGASGSIKNSSFKEMNAALEATAVSASDADVSMDAPEFENNNMDIEIVFPERFSCTECSVTLKTLPVGLVLPMPVLESEVLGEEI